MTDEELIRIALFKLKDTSKRLTEIGRRARTPGVSDVLLALAAEIERLEHKLRKPTSRAAASE